jgi:predicted small lipoprotein YifL
MKRPFTVFVILMMVVAISGCAAGPNELVNIPDDEGKVAGFWQGLWQGFVS